MNSREFDLVLYGASGYTASYVIKELENTPLRVALAARDISKIPETFLQKIQVDLEHIVELSIRTKILLNCVGLYTLTGEKIIQGCLETKTHYIDICGETFFIDEIFKKYNSEAKLNGLRIVQSCGFDSLPSDIGTFLLGTMHDIKEIDCCLVFNNCKINRTTWESLLLSLKCNLNNKSQKSFNKTEPENKNVKKLLNQHESTGVHKRIHFENFSTQDKENSKLDKPNLKSTVKRNKLPECRYNDSLKSYDVKFRGTDPFILQRSCEYFRRKEISDIKFGVYMNIGGLFKCTMYFILGFVLSFLINFRFFFNILNKYPSFFTLGLITNKPDPKLTEKGTFSIILKGKSTKREGKRVLTISGQDPGYKSTAIFLVQSAVTLFEELENTTPGVVTPAIAFYKTKIVDRLISKGIKFDYSDE